MRLKLKSDDAPEPFAIRTLDVAPSGRELLVGRHSSNNEWRLAIAAPDSLAWKDELSWALDGTAVFARFLSNPDAILFQDERGAVSVLSRHSQQVDLLNRRGKHISVSRQRRMAAICNVGVELLNLHERTATVWHFEQPRAVAAISPSESQLALAGSTIEGIDLYDVGSQTVSSRLGKTLNGAHVLKYDPTGRYLALIGGGMKGCTVWDLDRQATVGEIFCNPGQNNNFCLDLHPRLPFIAFGTFAGYVVLVNLEKNDLTYMEKLHEGQIWDIVFSPDGDHLFVAGDDGVLWRIEMSEMISLGTSRV
jgi:WD40 repeat protein